MKQTTNSILMIRPVAFRMNEQTAVNNYYQKVLDGLLPATVNSKAQQEFDSFVNNSLLDKNEREEFGKQTINDFEDIMKRIFPNAGLKKYFSLIRDKELQMHHETLQNAAKSMKNLNGYGKY